VFSLDIHTIKPECVLIDNAVNSIIAGAADGAPCVGRRATVTHAQKQIDVQSREKIRRRGVNSIKQFLSEGCFDLLMCGPTLHFWD
jgi:hypothetical protein